MGPQESRGTGSQGEGGSNINNEASPASRKRGCADPGDDVGPSSTENEADSGSWLQYLNFSSENDESESSTAQNPGHQPTSDRPVQPQPPAAENPGEAAPEPSTSSTWSGSWIDKWLNQEGSSSAPNEGGHEVTSQQPRVMEPAPAAEPLPAPSYEEVSRQLDYLTSSFNRIRMRGDTLIRLEDALHLRTPQKRHKILEFMELLSHSQGGERPRSGREAGDTLVKCLQEWERKQIG